MEIRPLGSLKLVSSSGARAEIGSAKQRELLALLAARASQVVSTDRLIDGLWGGEGDRRNSLRFHVAKLRDAIDPGRRERIRVGSSPLIVDTLAPYVVQLARNARTPWRHSSSRGQARAEGHGMMGSVPADA